MTSQKDIQKESVFT